MKLIRLYALALISMQALLFSCNDNGVHSKYLLGQKILSSNRKAYVLIENDSFIVSTDFEKLRDAFRPRLLKKKDFDEEKDLFKEIAEHRNDCPIYVNRIAKSRKSEHRLVYIIADLFESGDCVVYNKMMQRLETKVTIEADSSPMGYDGRKFLVGGIEILKTVDRIY